MKGHYDVHHDGSNWMKVVKEGMTENCSKDDLDFTAENMCSVIDLLIKRN